MIVVAGIRTPQSITRIAREMGEKAPSTKEALPDVFGELRNAGRPS